MNLAFKFPRETSPVVQEAAACWRREKSVYFNARQQRLFTGPSEDKPEAAAFYRGSVFIYDHFCCWGTLKPSYGTAVINFDTFSS